MNKEKPNKDYREEQRLLKQRCRMGLLYGLKSGFFDRGARQAKAATIGCAQCSPANP